MALSAKIVFDISNFNGNSDGSPSANDIDKIEIHKRIGPESGGGSFVLVSTITSGFSGHNTLDYEDTSIAIATPYYYKLLFYRGTDFAESIVGPVFISGLHELGYPGNVPSDTDGVPNYIGVAPLIHISAEYEYNFYGQQAIYDYATGEYPQNVNEMYPDWGLSNNHTVRVNSEGIPYINTGGTTSGAGGTYIFSMGTSGASTFNQLKSNIGAHPDSDLIAFDQGFTFAAVMLYQEFFGSKKLYQDHYSKWGITGLYNKALPKEWNLNGSMTLDSNNYTNDAHYNHPKNISDGDYYEPVNVGNFYGPPMGAYYPNARGYWGHRSYGLTTSTSSTFDTRTLRTFSGITNWSRTDEMSIHRNDTTKSLNTGAFYPIGADTNKLCTLIFRHKEDGTGTDVYVNGVLYHTSPHHQQTVVQNIGHNHNHMSGLDPASYPGAEGTYWSANNHTIRYNHKQSGHLLRSVYPNGAIENYEGITYHMPFILSSASVPSLLNYGGDSRLAFSELMMIPSSLTDPDFRRLTTYLGNKYGDALLPQGDYKK